jgi:serine/threonine protein kinase
MIGQKIGGYEIVERVGAGGMAEIYKAYDPSVDRFVAVKILLEEFSKDPEFRARFHLEAKSIALLEHAHILPIYAYGEQDSLLYLIMRYMPSGSLSDRIETHGQLPFNTACDLLHPIASALDYAHAHGVLHRDLKTDNVLLDSTDHAYLADFGLVKLLQKPSGRFTKNFLPGTPEYMSPEQCLGEDNLTPAADQYALGVVLYYMICGTVPFKGKGPLAVLHHHVNSPPPPPADYRINLPDATAQVMLHALAKRPEDRYASCTEFAQAFENSLGSNRLVDRFNSDLGDHIDAALERVQRKRSRRKK